MGEYSFFVEYDINQGDIKKAKIDITTIAKAQMLSLFKQGLRVDNVKKITDVKNSPTLSTVLVSVNHSTPESLAKSLSLKFRKCFTSYLWAKTNVVLSNRGFANVDYSKISNVVEVKLRHRTKEEDEANIPPAISQEEFFSNFFNVDKALKSDKASTMLDGLNFEKLSPEKIQDIFEIYQRMGARDPESLNKLNNLVSKGFENLTESEVTEMLELCENLYAYFDDNPEDLKKLEGFLREDYGE